MLNADCEYWKNTLKRGLKCTLQVKFRFMATKKRAELNELSPT